MYKYITLKPVKAVLRGEREENSGRTISCKPGHIAHMYENVTTKPLSNYYTLIKMF
jgi:hypothetical protein